MNISLHRAGEAGAPRWQEGLDQRYADLRERLGRGADCIDWQLQLPWLDAILQLKRETGIFILAHNYQRPEIYHAIADVTGDSLALAQAAADCDAERILVCGVHFMAESVKLLAPQRQVLIPDLQAGCSLAESIRAEDVRALRGRHPGVPVVSYVNTSAAVKAESDACCTSANAVQVVEAMGSERVIFLPDRYLGAHVASQTAVELILWNGCCEVHERFSAREVRQTRELHRASVLAHPECAPEVLQEADFVGSTAAMAQWLQRHQPARVALITECSMADNLRQTHPDIAFIQPCNLCPHMQRITLPAIYHSLRDHRHPIELDAGTAERARRALQRMLEIGRGPSRQ